MYINNVSNVVIYHEKSDISAVYMTDRHRKLAINGDVNRTICIDSYNSPMIIAVKGKITSLGLVREVSTVTLELEDGTFLTEKEWEERQVEYVRGVLESKGIVDEDLYDKKSIGYLEYQLAEKIFFRDIMPIKSRKTSNQVTIVEDDTKKYKFIEIPDIEFDRHIKGFFDEDNLSHHQLNHGYFIIKGQQIVIEETIKFCEKHGLKFEPNDSNHKFSKVSGKYMFTDNCSTSISLSNRHAFTYDEALKIKDNIIRTTKQKLSVLVKQELDKNERLSTIETLTYLKELVSNFRPKSTASFENKNRYTRVVECIDGLSKRLSFGENVD